MWTAIDSVVHVVKCNQYVPVGIYFLIIIDYYLIILEKLMVSMSMVVSVIFSVICVRNLSLVCHCHSELCV